MAGGTGATLHGNVVEALPIRDGKAASYSSIVVALGHRIRSFRTRSRYSLSALAGRSGVSRAMLSKVERGERNPTLAIIVRIAAGLNVSLSEFMATQADSSVSSHPSDSCYVASVSGFERHVLWPTNPENGVEFLLHRIPPRQSSGTLAVYRTPTEKYVVVIHATLTIWTGDARYIIASGESSTFPIASRTKLTSPANTIFWLLNKDRPHHGWVACLPSSIPG